MKGGCSFNENSLHFLIRMYLARGLLLGHRPLTTEAQVHSWACTCGVCLGESGSWTGLPPSILFFHVTSILPMLHSHI